MVGQMFPEHFGDLEPFHFAVTREQALEALEHFININLPSFGVYQDAMLEGETWMFHSHLSFYLNCGLLLPHECVEKVARAFYEKKAPLNSVEGFIRQILGWREFVRGIYQEEGQNQIKSNYWNDQYKYNKIKKSEGIGRKNRCEFKPIFF